MQHGDAYSIDMACPRSSLLFGRRHASPLDCSVGHVVGEKGPSGAQGMLQSASDAMRTAMVQHVLPALLNLLKDAQRKTPLSRAGQGIQCLLTGLP